MFTGCMENYMFFFILSDIRLLRLCTAVKMQDNFQHQLLFIHQVIILRSFLICFKKSWIAKGRLSCRSERFDDVLRCCPYIILVSWTKEKLLSWLKTTFIMTESLSGLMTSNQCSVRECVIVDAFVSVRTTGAGSASAGAAAQCSTGMIQSDNHIC